ncbi:hypothetical protein [Catellatospora methionotrophica]|uniref:hypothetical protein n=1 Tax=Catellatospora methionotrophica TaxID=121620 RepID=UPI0034058706
MSADGVDVAHETIESAQRMVTDVWRLGESYVLAPAMTAVVAAAADALDLTGEILPGDIAPSDHGVLFLPEPIYHRDARGILTPISVITWHHFADDHVSGWFVGGWSDPDDPDCPQAAKLKTVRHPRFRSFVGPYMLTEFGVLPIGRPVTPIPPEHRPEGDIDWETAPDGRYVIDAAHRTTRAFIDVLYAFWAIQDQPIATTATAPEDRTTSRRAARAGVTHGTRIVMLRRARPTTDRSPDAKWRYRVRFVVRGHWRRLINRDGDRHRVWVNSYVKGPDGAPMLDGEKVSVLAR